MKKNKSSIIAQQEAAIAENSKPKSKARIIVNIIVDVILVLAIIMAVAVTYTSFTAQSGSGVANIFGYTLYSVKSQSMYPTFESGDLLFSKKIKHDDMLKLKQCKVQLNDDGTVYFNEHNKPVVEEATGDIITYWTNINGEQVLNTHRLVLIYDAGDHLVFETKGDASNECDTLTVHEAYVVGVYLGSKWGGAGKVFDFLQSANGFLICVVLPVAIFFIFNLVQFFKSLFEYQNVKSMIKYEEDREKQESANEELQQATRKQLEDELRAKILEEMLAKQMQGNQPANSNNSETTETSNTDSDKPNE